jgi:LmbE family N-acetylglucosaminyl deacetylase
MKTKTLILFMLLSVLCYIFWLFACGSNENHVTNKHIDGSICVVFAHPDDETIISGTLAMLAAKDFDITVVYVTSGDDGPDETGRGLFGDTLAAERENESLQSLQAIGIKNPPVFLRFPDSHVPEYVDAVTQALYDLFNKITPHIVISFGPDGITDDWDHKMSGFAADFVFDLTDSGRLLLHMAISKNLSPFYATGVDVSEHAVNVRVNVAPYTNQRIRALEAHRTQFNSRVRFIYKALVQTMPTEEFIIARNRDAGQWLEKCFDIQEEKNKSNSEMIADSVFTSTD